MYYFIINPASGSGRGKKIWKTIQSELNRLNISYRAYVLSRPGEAKQLASGFAEKKTPCTVIAVGGDGTINDVIEGLGTFQNITFACIPTGSGNDFVRGLNLERDPIKALHVILNPNEIRPINIGTVCIVSPVANPSVTDASAAHAFSSDSFASGADTAPADRSSCAVCEKHSFAVSSGIGFDAAVCHSVQNSKLKKALNLFHAGKVVYLLSALWLLLTMKRGSLRVITKDGQTKEYPDIYFAAAMNLPYEGGGFHFCPDAKPDDDCFDLLIANNISRIRAPYLLLQAFRGKHIGKKGISITQCTDITLQFSVPSCVHTDGEVVGFHEKIQYTMKPEKLPVIIR